MTNRHDSHNARLNAELRADGIEVLGPVSDAYAEILTPAALRFVAGLEREFGARRVELLAKRQDRQREIDNGTMPDFLPETKAVREADWTILGTPDDLQDRRVEITGPVDRKMVINALNSGAKVFMADFEDSNAPTWDNNIQGHINLRDAVNRTITLETPQKQYKLNDDIATLLVRPRGWHLEERHILVDGKPISGAFVDFGFYFFHNVKSLLAHGTGPYFYLPKMESHLEARLWNDVFNRAQEELGIPHGTIKTTVLIETILAAFEIDEILYELRDHIVGCNCGRWDYIFSFIKRFRNVHDVILPDRAQVTMTVPNMRNYSLLTIQTCHKRKAHAIGGMAAQIPIKNDPEANEAALEKVRADKEREASDGHDGTWVAHPGLVPIALEVFNKHMPQPNQLDKLREDVQISAADLVIVPEGTITEDGLRLNVRVGIQYIEAWLRGNGCVPLYNLMEDAATAEISRTQVWQWLHHSRGILEDGRTIDEALVRRVIDEEMERIKGEVGGDAFENGRFPLARQLFEESVLREEFDEFLTLPAYEHILSLPTDAAHSTGASHGGDTRTRKVNTMSYQPPTAQELAHAWETDPRWEGVERNYSAETVVKLRGTVHIEHSLARMGSERLWELMHTDEYVRALGCLTGNQAMQCVKAGLKALYLSGWQVAGDNNIAGQMYPDQSLYPSNSAPELVRRINNTLRRADEIHHAEGNHDYYWYAPIMADAEAGFGGALNAFELMKAMIVAGASGVHFEDQLSSEKKCGHMGGKVCIPTAQFIKILNSARLAADVMGVPTILVARTDSKDAKLLTSDVDERDRPFLTGDRTPEGFHIVNSGLDVAISRAQAYAPYADMIWCETQHPDLEEAKRFAEGVHEVAPGKMLAYNCSPSFNWEANLDDATIAKFQRELAAMGYKFQFITLAGFHSLNHSMFDLARHYNGSDAMTAYVDLQQREFGDAVHGYTATKHQREVGAGYFDAVATAVSGGHASTTALSGSSEEEQFSAVSA